MLRYSTSPGTPIDRHRAPVESTTLRARNVAPLLAVSGPPALGVAVRVNATHAFFAIAVEAEGPSRTLTQGEVSLPAKPIGAPGAQLLAVERDGSDYRPCLSTPPPMGGRLVALSGGAGAISRGERRRSRRDAPDSST